MVVFIKQKLKIIENLVAELRQNNETKHQEFESKIKELKKKIRNADKKNNTEKQIDQIHQSMKSTTLRIFNMKENTR